jgi:glycosyltransferase involved in cell wall biosynthesis
MNAAIVYVTYDGAVNSTCGVGVLSQYFIKAMPSVATHIQNKLKVKVSFHVIAVNLKPSAHGYSKIIKGITSNITSSLNGKLHFVGNGTSGHENYGNIKNWEIASKNAASAIELIAKDYDNTYAFLVDTPFLNLPKYMDHDTRNVKYVLLPHSDVYSHFPENIPPARLEWEKESFSAVNKISNVYLASTSQYLADIISVHHKIKKDKIIKLQTGLLLSDDKFNLSEESEIAHKLSIQKIPLDKPIIFSVARAVPYKGFENLIDIFRLLLNDNINAHLVFIAAPFKNLPSNVETLKNKINKLNLHEHCTAIYNLDMELPRYIYQWKNTKIVAQLSSREPFGLVPEEVRLLARAKGPIVVTGNRGGFLEQIDNGQDGFLLNPSDHTKAKEVFKHIINMTEDDYNSIKRRGYKRCISNYDYTKTIIACTESLAGLKW